MTEKQAKDLERMKKQIVYAKALIWLPVLAICASVYVCIWGSFWFAVKIFISGFFAILMMYFIINVFDEAIKEVEEEMKHFPKKNV